MLGEVVPSVGVKQKTHETAEVIPGPTTDYFGELARKNNLHIVLSLYERDGHLVYNAAVLLGPDGKLIGKYRKVCLPPRRGRGRRRARRRLPGVRDKTRQSRTDGLL